MKKTFMKFVVPTMLVASSLGMGAVVATVPAGASSKTTIVKSHAQSHETLTGKVIKTDVAKKMFWFKVGTKTYRADYTATTPFTKGTASSLVKGLSVTVVGTALGKSHTVLRATSIAA